MNNITTYDDIWTSVRENYKGNPNDIPQSEEAIYRCIANAINDYNKKAKKYEDRLSIITHNVELEEVTPQLSNEELLILTYITCSLIARDTLLQFSSIYSVFSSSLGLKNIKGQSDVLRQNLEYFENKVQSSIEDLIDTFNL